jgi:rfaE bifunctional protein kinase chain/domain
MKNITDIRILVVGDIMLDKYIVGEVKRISPEAPVPIINVFEEYHTLGGCGNVVRNIRELGAQVDCLASVGRDIYSDMIFDELEKIGVKDLLIMGSKQTTVKERLIANHRHVQMLRVDRESTRVISPEKAINNFKKKCRDNYDIVIVSDYAKGMITMPLMDFLKNNQSARIIVDPKPQQGGMYNDVHMITPNEKEWESMQVTSNYVLDKVSYTLVTKGKRGMKLIRNDTNDFWNISAEPVEIYNVSGAGDTVIAIMAVCLSMGYNELNATYIANKCAGYVVTQTGTSVVPKNKFTQILSEYNKNIE